MWGKAMVVRRAIVAAIPDKGGEDAHNQLRHLLEVAGYMAVSCTTGAIALNALREARVDCLIADPMVAHRWEILVNEAKRNNKNTGIVILCASEDEVDDVEKFSCKNGYNIVALNKLSRDIFDKFELYLDGLRSNTCLCPERAMDNSEIFIVHAFSSSQMERVVSILRALHTDPYVLCLEASDGLTLAEQIEAASHVKLAIAIVTADDPYVQPDGNVTMRPRQNVIFEFGFFAGHLGRKGVICLKESGADLPSDLHGVRYLSLDMPDLELKLALAQVLGKAEVKYRL